MKIFVDADACPVVGIVEELAKKYTIPGNPCMFHKSLIPELLQLTGDQGGRKVLKQHTCRYVEIEDEKELMDIDVSVY